MLMGNFVKKFIVKVKKLVTSCKYVMMEFKEKFSFLVRAKYLRQIKKKKSV